MQDGKQLKYGQISGGEMGMEVALAANQVIFAASGKFVKRTGSGTPTVTLAVAGDSDLLGHLETEALNSSDGTEIRKCIFDTTAIFRIPVSSGTYAKTMRGKLCDLAVAANIQGAALGTATAKCIVVVNGDDVNNNWVDVRLSEQRTFVGVA